MAQTKSLQDMAQEAAVASMPKVTIYEAKEIVTLDPAKPRSQAVAVVGDRILAVGSLEELKAGVGTQAYTVDNTFKDHVIVPGFIAQHDHPMLAAVTMTTKIIAIEDWAMPDKTYPAAKDRAEYLRLLSQANAEVTNVDEPLVSWGYHHYFHGNLQKTDLDGISETRPIIVWHRSAHEFFLNTAAEKKFGVNRAWFAGLKDSEKKQSDFDNAHYWEQGAFALMPLIASAIATPEKVKADCSSSKSTFTPTVSRLVVSQAAWHPRRCRTPRTLCSAIPLPRFVGTTSSTENRSLGCILMMR